MTEPVKPPRPYRSSTRDAQTHRTRQAILDAARLLFLRDGFAATTVPAVAAEAGVAVPTVYKAFGNKSLLAKAVFDVAIAGDDEEGPVSERRALTAVREEPDPYEKLRKYGEFLAVVAPRHVPVQLVIRDAAATNPDARSLWEELQAERLVGMTTFADALAREGFLRRGVGRETARDVLWTLNSAELFALLVLDRGWTPRRYGRWVADALTAALLPSPRD